MNVVRHAALGRQREQIKHLAARRRRNVVDAEANTERAFVQALFDEVGHLTNFVRRGMAINSVVARQEAARVLQHGHFRRDVSDRRAEVDERFAFALGVPGGHRGHADLHFKRRRYAIACFVTIVLVILPVRMQINKAGRDDQPFGVNHCASA